MRAAVPLDVVSATNDAGTAQGAAGVMKGCVRTRSRTRLMGHAMGNMTTRKILTSQSVLAPISSPWREHAACGTISPRTTMSMVEMMAPSTPAVRSAMEMAISAALGRPPQHPFYISNTASSLDSGGHRRGDL